MQRAVTEPHVQAVLAIDDRVLRNYWVTQTYADLAAGLATVLGPTTNNWCAFAVWASSTVGWNLRGDGLPEWLHDRVVLDDGMMGAVERVAADHGWARVEHLLHHLTPDHVIDVVRELFGVAAINLSEGNTEVFAEIAPAAARFLSIFPAAPPGAPAPRGDADDRARVLEACADAPEFEGKNHLAAGFSLWCDALATIEEPRRSQLILAGSLELGTHEQNHLQGAIASSIDMGMNDSATRLEHRLRRGGKLSAEIGRIADDLLAPVVGGIGTVWDDVMTELLGVLRTPDGTLRLGHDVPPVPGQPFVPGDLAAPVVPELVELLGRFDRSTGDGRQSAARDWVQLDDRMNFIANLFRSRHHRTEFLDPPFDPMTVASLEADRIPGALPTGAAT